MGTFRDEMRILDALAETGLALSAALTDGRTRDASAPDQGFPGRLGASLRVWLAEFGTPEIGATGLEWPMDDGLLTAAVAKLHPDAHGGGGREPVVSIERRWTAGREPDMFRAMEVAESLLPGDARPKDHAWLATPEAEHPLAGLHLISWTSALEHDCPLEHGGPRASCPYGGGVSLVVKELAPDVVSAFWIVAVRQDGFAAT